MNFEENPVNEDLKAFKECKGQEAYRETPGHKEKQDNPFVWI